MMSLSFSCKKNKWRFFFFPMIFNNRMRNKENIRRFLSMIVIREKKLEVSSRFLRLFLVEEINTMMMMKITKRWPIEYFLNGWNCPPIQWRFIREIIKFWVDILSSYHVLNVCRGHTHRSIDIRSYDHLQRPLFCTMSLYVSFFFE